MYTHTHTHTHKHTHTHNAYNTSVYSGCVYQHLYSARVQQRCSVTCLMHLLFSDVCVCVCECVCVCVCVCVCIVCVCVCACLYSARVQQRHRLMHVHRHPLMHVHHYIYLYNM